MGASLDQHSRTSYGGASAHRQDQAGHQAKAEPSNNSALLGPGAAFAAQCGGIINVDVKVPIVDMTLTQSTYPYVVQDLCDSVNDIRSSCQHHVMPASIALEPFGQRFCLHNVDLLSTSLLVNLCYSQLSTGKPDLMC